MSFENNLNVSNDADDATCVVTATPTTTTTVVTNNHNIDELALEKRKNAFLTDEVERLRLALHQLGAVSEFEEERIANRLIKRLGQMKAEKEKLALEIEQEEELLTNTLSKKLTSVRQEKVDMENELEREQEYMTNKLQKQLGVAKFEKEKMLADIQGKSSTFTSQLQRALEDKIALQQSLDHEQEFVVNKLQKQLLSLKADQRKRALSMKEQHVKALDTLAQLVEQLKFEDLNSNDFACRVLNEICAIQQRQLTSITSSPRTHLDDQNFDYEPSSTSSVVFDQILQSMASGTSPPTATTARSPDSNTFDSNFAYHRRETM